MPIMLRSPVFLQIKDDAWVKVDKIKTELGKKKGRHYRKVEIIHVVLLAATHREPQSSVPTARARAWRHWVREN
jgi:hypothetical protein